MTLATIAYSILYRVTLTLPFLSDHKQLHSVVLDRLRDLIMQGELHAGEWLRQERLAHELGVSHTPIREALSSLKSKDWSNMCHIAACAL